MKDAAKKICVAYDGMDRFFPSSKLVVTGNPIRQDILDSVVTREESLTYFSLKENKKTILIVGGSLGARTINEAIAANLGEFQKENIQLLWQTGKNYTGEFGEFAWGTRTDFIQRMDMAYKVADVVISRAGAMSVSELSALGKATIFVPSPFVSEDHQTKNAMSLVHKGAALLCKDTEATEKLGQDVIALLNDNTQVATLQQEIKKLGLPLAAQNIVKEIVADLGS
jgi:UDP-N-acetylglucosamine--N-acetylmuramyl-(pentapeptide) pyrophosphoryl-undecaprenol N-acetylglucosamine transferase